MMRAFWRTLWRRRRACAWCGATLGRAFVPFRRATHGICPSCDVEYGGGE